MADKLERLSNNYRNLLENTNYHNLPLATDSTAVDVYEKAPITVNYEAFELSNLGLDKEESIQLKSLQDELYESFRMGGDMEGTLRELVELRVKQFDKLLEQHNDIKSLIDIDNRHAKDEYVLSPAYYVEDHLMVNFVSIRSQSAVVANYKLTDVINGVFFDRTTGRIIRIGFRNY